MTFALFKQKQVAHMAAMFQDTSHLFVVDVDKDALWNTYLDSFPPGSNEIYRERREHDCSCCRSFIKQFGNVVKIQGTSVQTIWDFNAPGCYAPVVHALSATINQAVVSDVLVTKKSKYGTDTNIELMDNGQAHTWSHFHAVLPKALVYSGPKTEASVMGEYRDSRNVFKRSLDEITGDALETVMDLIEEKTLYRGEEWLPALTQFRELFNYYHELRQKGFDHDAWTWGKSVTLGGSVSRIRNHSIGTLLQDLSEDMPVDQAMRRYEAVMAPANYKRPKAVFTKKMVEAAEKTVVDLGLVDSLPRRHAVIGDISVNNVLWANRDVAKVMGGAGGVFDLLKSEVTVKPKQYDNVTAMPIDRFIADILPHVQALELLVENKHQPNLMSLISPVNPGARPITKWSNNFGWAYTGNVADSSLRERVKAAGGSVTGVLRFSIQWNHGVTNIIDFDAHCVEPHGNEIFYARKFSHTTQGNLDVDIIHPHTGVPAVENITWPKLDIMREGEYRVFVHNYSSRTSTAGFEAEIEYGGETWQYVYDKQLPGRQNVTVARFMFTKRDGIKFLESLPSTTSSRSIWAMATNQFYPVSSVMFSPNYWDGQVGAGNKHYLFMIPTAKSDENPNGFFNEYLSQDLMTHKHVFEALGSKMKVAPSDSQLSGLGFSSTKRNSIVIKHDGKLAKIVF